MCMCVCACLCVSKRERESVYLYVCERYMRSASILLSAAPIMHLCVSVEGHADPVCLSQNHEFVDEQAYEAACMEVTLVNKLGSRTSSLSSSQHGLSSCCSRPRRRSNLHLPNCTSSVRQGSLQELSTIHIQERALPNRFSLSHSHTHTHTHTRTHTHTYTHTHTHTHTHSHIHTHTHTHSHIHTHSHTHTPTLSHSLTHTHTHTLTHTHSHTHSNTQACRYITCTQCKVSVNLSGSLLEDHNFVFD